MTQQMSARGKPAPGSPVPVGVRRAVDVLACVVGLGAAWYLAPIEYQAGRWLGLPVWQAWTITAVVEGFTVAALVAGLYARALVPIALTLTWVSACTGQLHAAAEHAAELGGTLDRPQVAAALVVCTLMVIGPALMHVLRGRVAREHAAWEAVQAAKRAAAAEAERAHQLELQQAEAERAEQERRDAERFAAAERAHELELLRSRAFAEQEQARLALEAERVRAAQDEARAAAERARAEAEREQAAAEQARAAAEQRRAADEQRRADAEQARRAAEQERARAEQARAAYEKRLRDDRAFACTEWLQHRWDADDLAAKIGVSSGRARALVAEWRSAAVEEAAVGA
jgi:hypothetical protein